jgi:hypothetical protein
LKFEYQTIRHSQDLTPTPVAASISHCEKSFALSDVLSKVYFQRSQWIVIGNDKHLIVYRQGDRIRVHQTQVQNQWWTIQKKEPQYIQDLDLMPPIWW